MSGPDSFAAGFEVPLHRSLTEPILLGGAPRTVAIANGTLAAAVGLGLQLWIPGVVLWIVGHSLACGARVDPQFMQVFARHIKHRRCWTCRRRRHAEPCRIPPAARLAGRLAALGRADRAGRRAEQGWLVSAHGALSRA
jgi:type IV secretion system protein VirB3